MVQSSIAQAPGEITSIRECIKIYYSGELYKMSDAVVVGILTAAVSLIGIFVSSKNTRDSVTHKLDTNQQLMNMEITHIKNDMSEMKTDIKSHNNYAKLFAETVPVIREQMKVANHRIEDLEKEAKAGK